VLYIDKLSQRTRASDLEQRFVEVGQVLNCHLVLDRNGDSRGFAFLTMRNNEDAEAAIRKLNSSELDGRIISVQLVCFTSSA
jgi:RNA recognition motif-containing protein